MTRLPDLEAWAIFAAIAEAGSFSKAAVMLGLSKATVSKAITRLEARLGVMLFHRGARKLVLSEAGRNARARATSMLREAEAADEDALAEATAPRGTVRLAAPMSFGLAHVAVLLPDFLAEHPGIAVDLHLNDAVIDLVGDGFDLALRIAVLADSTLRARRLCAVRRMVVGTPDYFDRHGRPVHPRDLPGHACLGYAYLPTPETWAFTDRAGETLTISPAGPLRANNAEALTPALLAGLGVAVQPEFTVWEHLATGRLEAVLTDWSLPEIALNIVTPPGSLRPARVTALIDFLSRKLALAPWAAG